ncbi:MAG: ATP-dependent 6-phosphofructokinase [Myxococcales bacterium]|nr:ATP-dependent 6-phosphofructokinase [Myxococcales bacterium]
MVSKLGLLTGGGDCPGLNAVLWAVVRAADQQGIRIVGIEDGYDGLCHAKPSVRALRPGDVRQILGQGGTVLGSTNRGNPFRYAVQGADGTTCYEDRSQTVIDNVARLGLDGLIAIGGDGTLNISQELASRGLKVVGVPKTIDNDLSATDSTFGFSTAVGTAMEALDRLKTTGESHDRVMILEVMGRYAGWIALHAGLSGGAHFVLVPELPYRLDVVLQRIRRHWAQGRRHFTLIVVAEGAHEAGSAPLHVAPGRPGSVPRVGGAGIALASALDGAFAEANTWSGAAPEVRTTVLGHLQRGGSPCAFDRVLSVRFGAEAVALAAHGRWNRMVCLRGTDIASVPIEETVRRPHRVDPDGQLVRHTRAVGICLGDA